MIKPKVQTTTKGQDKVNQLLKFTAALNKSYVQIGITEDAGSYIGQGTDHPEVVQVALWMEFGTETIPARSFVGSTMDENASLLNKWREESLDKIALGTWTVEQALTAIGERIKILIQNKIKSNMPPPLDPEYAKMKAREGLAPVTLIRTGVMLRSVTYKVFLS